MIQQRNIIDLVWIFLHEYLENVYITSRSRPRSPMCQVRPMLIDSSFPATPLLLASFKVAEKETEQQGE